MTKQPLLMSPDMELAAKLRENFSSTHCVEELLRAVVDMAGAIGVTVSWKIDALDNEKEVNRDDLSQALGRLATAGGAMLMGGKVNPISTLAAQDPMRLIREYRQG